MAALRLRQLEDYLQQLEVFEKPKVSLEQYATSAHIASHMLYTAQSQFNDIEGKSLADLGSGCGVLSMGAKMLGAGYVIGFEIDSDAIDLHNANCSDIELYVEIVQCDILQYLPGIYMYIYLYIYIFINIYCIYKMNHITGTTSIIISIDFSKS